MERMEQMASLAAEAMRRNFTDEIGDIFRSLGQGSQQIKDSIASAVIDALHEAARRGKGPIAYVTFSLLQSNLLLDRYTLRVDALNDRFLLDDVEAASEWDFQFIFQKLGPDMDAVGAKVRETMTRVQDYELRELERAYLLNYYGIAFEVLRAALPSCLPALIKSPAPWADEVNFTVGGYMEQQQIICQWRPMV